MRLATDGGVEGRLPWYLCRASGRVPHDFGPEQPFVALHPMINYRPYIAASPDVFPPGHPGYDQGVAGDLQIPAPLRERIEQWVAEFTGNFLHLGDRPVDQPVWRDGFDEIAWLRRGHALAEELGAHYPGHAAFCCAEEYVVCELAAEQLNYVCALTGPHYREDGWRMPGNEPDPDQPGELKLMPEYGVEWGLWDGWLPYHQPPRLRAGPGRGGFTTPRSLGLTSDLEERLRRWNEDWRHGFLGYGPATGSGPDADSGAALGLPGYGFALPRWVGGVDPVAWYREGHAIAARLAEELPGVRVRLSAVRYVCAGRFRHEIPIFDDDEYWTRPGA
ncbi:hypothetical protein NCCP2495_16890 [Dietzia sp. NCCP-2495]|uniref:hypothetical protein n=1 Tax=Dietzia sp. NCCP-2495 TaxID=2934675 RepID=UPI00223161CC|nr:hypothetical protein [Dietzia sp. NCCP-2495]GLB63810.1 hypothetical protein NCCP2495_16890 [Dietzia sp. NCCP-2495]